MRSSAPAPTSWLSRAVLSDQFVEVVGDLLERLASRGRLDSPWAVTLAPSTFGAAGGDILVGNFGDGRINRVALLP